MQRQIRRKDRVLEPAQTRELLNNGEFGVLATCGGDDQPYGVPVNYVVLEGVIYIHCAVTGRKLEIIRENSRVSFTVVGVTQLLPDQFSTRYESVIVVGRAAMVADAGLRRRALQALVAKYAADHAAAGEDYIDSLFDKVGVIRLSLDHVTGKARR